MDYEPMEIYWCSNRDLTPPPETCGDDYHAYRATDPAGAICECGKTIWVFVMCPTCKNRHGEPHPLNTN